MPCLYFVLVDSYTIHIFGINTIHIFGINSYTIHIFGINSLVIRTYIWYKLAGHTIHIYLVLLALNTTTIQSIYLK